MKKSIIASMGLAACSSFLFNSCINKDYDWDNLNKEATIHVGNIPLGNIAPLRIDSLLANKMSAGFEYGTDGSYTLLYKGTFEISHPVFRPMETEPLQSVQETISLPTAIYPDPVVLQSNGSFSYAMTDPYDEENNDDWVLRVDSVTFLNCELTIGIQLENLYVGDDLPQLVIEYELPDNIITNAPASNRLTANLRQVADQAGVFYFDPVRIEKFIFHTPSEIHYKISIRNTGNTLIGGTGENDSFRFVILTDTREIHPYQVFAYSLMDQTITDKIEGIEDFGNAFSGDEYFTIKNPGMFLDVHTNLGLNFQMFIDELQGTNGEQVSPTLSNLTPGGIDFPAPVYPGTNETTYYLAETNDRKEIVEDHHFFPVNLNTILAVKPTEINYCFLANNTYVSNKSGTFYYQESDRIMESGYTMRIPFSFESVSMTFSDTLEGVFSEDIADKLFYEACEFSIIADEMEIRLGGGTAGVGTGLVVSVLLLDDYMEPIDVDVEPAQLNNPNGINKLDITIRMNDQQADRMKEARHIQFNFTLTGNDLTLNRQDHIEIRKLKFKTTAGIKIDL